MARIFLSFEDVYNWMDHVEWFRSHDMEVPSLMAEGSPILSPDDFDSERFPSAWFNIGRYYGSGKNEIYIELNDDYAMLFKLSKP